MVDYSFEKEHSEIYDLQTSKKFAIKLKRTTEMTENDKISIMSDVMFKTLFCNSERLYFGAKFLSYFINYKYEDILKNIKLTKTDLDKETINIKSERCDYVAILDDTQFNIEVNCNDSKDTMLRNMDYAFRQFGSKIKVGEAYEFTKVLQINVNNFAFKNRNKIIDVFGIQSDDKIRLSNNIIFIQIYVPNINEKWYNEGIESLSEMEKFVLSLAKTDKQEAKNIALGDDFMEKLLNEQVTYSMPNDLRESYDHELAMHDQGRREGLEEGIKQGIEKGSTKKQLEIINNMLELKMSKEEITKILKISVSELDNLINDK